MKRTLLVAILIGIGIISKAQRCGTMELLNSLYEKNPELRIVHDSIDKATQIRITQNYPWTIPTTGKFPPIPGFMETGNREEDLKNYHIAKQNLFAKDPEEYYRLTRTPTEIKRK